MTEATWGDDAMSPDIDWRMSASLQNVPRGGSDLPEVTSLAGAVSAWQALDPEHRRDATLTPERPLVIDGATVATLHGEGIAALVSRLPSGSSGSPA
jgi:hypothetical protein